MDSNGSADAMEDPTKGHGPVPRSDDLKISTDNLRLQRIEQYQREALEIPSAEQANLTAANGGLFRIACQLDEAIIALGGADPKTFERSEKILAAIEMLLKVSRQIERYARLTCELRNERTNNQVRQGI